MSCNEFSTNCNCACLSMLIQSHTYWDNEQVIILVSWNIVVCTSHHTRIPLRQSRISFIVESMETRIWKLKFIASYAQFTFHGFATRIFHAAICEAQTRGKTYFLLQTIYTHMKLQPIIVLIHSAIRSTLYIYRIFIRKV